MQDSCKPILGVAVDSQDEYLDHIEELTHKLSVAEKSIAVVKVCLTGSLDISSEDESIS